MAKDLPGFVAAWAATIVKMKAPNGPLYGKSADADLLRALFDNLHNECVAQGVTGI
jgi:hypothetical protein